jgi:hypothetical protein
LAAALIRFPDHHPWPFPSLAGLFFDSAFAICLLGCGHAGQQRERCLTDRLDLTNAFEAAGIERKAAEHLAAEIFDAIRENVATKADLSELRTELKADVAAVRADLQRLEARVDLVEHRLFTRLGGLAVVLWGLLFAALHYWPPHG